MDWLAETGAPRATYERALANAFPTLELAAPAVIDPGDPDAGTYAIPARTVELAHQLADRWGLHGDTSVLRVCAVLLRPDQRPGGPGHRAGRLPRHQRAGRGAGPEVTRKSLSDSFRPDPGDPTLALDTQRPLPAQPPPEDGLVQVYAVVGVRTSAGAEIGPKRLPPAEAGRLVAMRFAVYGDRAPGAAEPESTVRPFGGPVPARHPAVSN